MKRRHFLSVIASLPGLGWVKPAEPKPCERAEIMRLLHTGGSDPGTILYGVKDLPCECAECREMERTLHLHQINILAEDNLRRWHRLLND